MAARKHLPGTLVLALGLLVASAARCAADASDQALVRKGAGLAAIGNCASCHTAEGGRAFAGGRGLETPFGTIYSTNITPDRDTGIGRWSQADFLRAMHEGLAPGGRELYPAFPYDHFTRVTDDDVHALYAYLLTREPVHASAPRNALRFPMSLRPSIALWKLAFFRPGKYRPDPSRDAEWNRGAYLAEGLAHCGACHTPRNPLGAERRDRDLEGGEAEGWHASALAANSPAPTRWTADELYAYLRTGRDTQHGIAAGPMTDVTHNLAEAPDDDVRAIAVYISSRMPQTPAQPPREPRAGSAEGASIFAGACAACHGAVPPAFSGASIPLSSTTSLNAPDSRNVIHIVMEGLKPRPGERGEWMPGFAAELTDAQLVALVDYLRAQYTGRPAWRDVQAHVAAIRRSLEEEP